MKTAGYHIPVLLKETVELLITDRNGAYLDCTLGGGGHSKAILESITSEGFLIAVDRDIHAIEYSGRLLESYNNFKTRQINFSRINELEEVVFGMKFDGILLDLGLSSKQIDDAERGFSYLSDAELDMRMNRDEEISAVEIIKEYSQEELEDIFFRYGEEKRSRRIASKIVQVREKKDLNTTKELTEVISSVIPANFRIKTLSRIFQALRIEVNKELDELATVLKFSLNVLKDNGRCAVISYHSLEDRTVKNFIREYSEGCTCPSNFPKCICGKRPVIESMTKKPVIASDDEIIHNSRARSAKLRVFRKL